MKTHLYFKSYTVMSVFNDHYPLLINIENAYFLNNNEPNNKETN